MDKRIVFKNLDGSCGVIVPSPNWEGTLEELAQKDVPEGLEWKIISTDDLPKSRNYRNAWTYELDIDLEKAKQAHKRLIAEKAHDRVERDELGIQNFDTVRQEIAALDIDNAEDLDTLYNTWPLSIERRSSARKYIK